MIENLRLLQQVADGDYDGGSDEMLESLGLDPDEGCVDVDEAVERLHEMPLAVETTTTFEVLLGVGGPDQVLCFECDPVSFLTDVEDGRRHPIAFEIRRVLYRYSWSGSAELVLGGAGREVAEAVARRVVPELA